METDRQEGVGKLKRIFTTLNPGKVTVVLSLLTRQETLVHTESVSGFSDDGQADAEKQAEDGPPGGGGTQVGGGCCGVTCCHPPPGCLGRDHRQDRGSLSRGRK